MDALIETGDTIAGHLWAVSWQASILIVIIGLISFVVRSTSPEFRYWLWIIVLVRLCIPVGISIPLGFDTYSLLRGMEFSVREQAPGVSSVPSALQTEQNEPLTVSVKDWTTPAKSSRQNRQLFPPAVILAWSWLAGVLSIGVVVLIRIVRLNGLLKKCPAVENTALKTLLQKLCTRMGIDRPVRLFYLDNIHYTSPAVAGIIRPRIFLPRAITDSLTPEELVPILLHELAHIKRRDILVNWLQVVVQTFYFFHPLIWLANREIRRFREESCDDMAIHHSGAEKERYTESIVAALKHTGREPAWGFTGLGFTERSNSLARRIKRIVQGRYRCRTGLSASMVIALVAIGVVSFALACSKEKPENVAEPLTYYPLKTGSEWILKGYGTTPTISYKVVGTEKKEDVLYSIIESHLVWEHGKDEVIIYARCENNCVYWRISPQQEQLKFDFNTEINQSWVKFITYNDSTRGAITGRITGRNLTVKVPAGVFDRCIVHEITETRKTNDRISTVLYTYWMAPDVGVVKITVNISGILTPVDLWVNELSSYYIPYRPLRETH